MSTPIALKDLTKRFGSTVAVDHVNLDITAGSLFFLLGPSGCGKTTLLRMLAGFTEPSSGRILFGEQDVTHLPANRRNCGMVFQGYALWPHMTVRQNVAFGLGVRKVAAEAKNRRVDAALRMVQMLPYAERKPNELSGGQQQRVALARALVIEPTLLLLDEPLSNLDAKLRLDMRSQIKRICKEARITAVYVTHDQKEALSMADQIALLREGRIVQVGPPEQVYHRPANRFVADFMGETNFVPAETVGREDPIVRLHCPAGELQSSTYPADLPAAGNVTCSIRPEVIKIYRMGDPSAPKVNTLPVRRIDSTFLGEMSQHTLALGENDAITLKVFELNPRPDSPLASSGDGKALIHIDPSDVVILQD